MQRGRNRFQTLARQTMAGLKGCSGEVKRCRQEVRDDIKGRTSGRKGGGQEGLRRADGRTDRAGESERMQARWRGREG